MTYRDIRTDYEQPRLVVPALKPFYKVVEPFSWPIIRCAAGLILTIHGVHQITNLANFLLNGIVPPTGVLVTSVHTLADFIGGICIALGFLTRFFAPVAAIEMAIITFGVYWKRASASTTTDTNIR